MSVYISTKDLLLLGVSERTIKRRVNGGLWIAIQESGQGQVGRPRNLILLSSLPSDLQLKWARLDAERGASAAGDCSIEGRADLTPSPDSRLQALQVALARFSPPQYTLDQRQAVESRCLELAQLCDSAIRLIGKLKQTTGISVASSGANEAGPGRAYHPSLAELAARTASTDPVYLEMYPSASKPLSTSTFLRLLDKYQKKGLVAFIRQTQTLSPAKDKRFVDMPLEAIDWLRVNLKSYVKSSVTLYGERWLEWARRNDVKLPFTESRPGVPNTCYYFLSRWKKSVPAVSMVLAREGMRGVENRFAIITRNYEDLEPRVGWTMDYRTFDLACWLPFKKDKSKKPALVRLTLCTVFDLKARAVFGWHIDEKPSAKGVTLAYVDALSFSQWKQEAGFEKLYGQQRGANGIEPFALWDNGREFTAHIVEGKEIKVGKIELENGLVSILESLKIGLAVDAQFKVRHAKPYNAKSKTVEPFHRYGIGLWEEGLPGFCGNKTTAKPHFYKAALAVHKTFANGHAPKAEDLSQLPPLWRDTYEVYRDRYGFGTPFLSEADLRLAFKSQMIAYNQKPHGSLANERGEMSPVEYINLFGGEPHAMRETTLTALAMLARVEMVDADKITMRWFGEKFVYNEVSSDLSDGTALMRLPERMKVEVRYNPANVGRALVLAQGVTLCWVESPQLMGWNASRDDFQRANADKKKAKQTAQEFFKTQQPSDWRDYAAERLPEALPLAVGADDITPIELPDSADRGASVTVLTRFDRKSSDALLNAPTSAVSHLRVVNTRQDEDEFNSLKTFESDGSSDEIKAGWED
jgi:hypothetical protein